MLVIFSHNIKTWVGLEQALGTARNKTAPATFLAYKQFEDSIAFLVGKIKFLKNSLLAQKKH